MREITVTLGGQEYVIQERLHRENTAWRKKLEEPFTGLVQALETGPGTDLSNAGDVGALIRSFSGLLIGSIDLVAGLLVEYAPQVEGTLEEAYDSEIVEAFTAVLGLAYPFGSLLDRVRILAPTG